MLRSNRRTTASTVTEITPKSPINWWKGTEVGPLSMTHAFWGNTESKTCLYTRASRAYLQDGVAPWWGKYWRVRVTKTRVISRLGRCWPDVNRLSVAWQPRLSAGSRMRYHVRVVEWQGQQQNRSQCQYKARVSYLLKKKGCNPKLLPITRFKLPITRTTSSHVLTLLIMSTRRSHVLTSVPTHRTGLRKYVDVIKLDSAHFSTNDRGSSLMRAMVGIHSHPIRHRRRRSTATISVLQCPPSCFIIKKERK